MSELLAQNVPALSDVLGVLSETVLGIVVILMILGYLWAKPAVEALKKQLSTQEATIKSKDEELATLRKSIEHHVIPSIEKNAHVADRVVALLEENKDTARRLVDVLDRLDGR